METAFWILFGLVFYTYLGYGLLLFLITRIKRLAGRKNPVPRPGFEPEVSLVIPAYNEEDIILDKIKNCLELDYPKEKLRILFITDGSTDRTPELLRNAGMEVLHQDERRGKAAAENRAMKHVTSPVVVFCDANTMLNRQSIKELVKYYRDPEIGGVSGEKRISVKRSDGAGAAGESLYWRYESVLKRWDFEIYSIVGAAGELVSFRTDLVSELEEDTILDDFVQSLRICEKGYRIAYEPNAFAEESASESVREELKRKIRIAAGGWQAMGRLPGLLNPFKNFLLSFQYLSHRVLRWSLSAFALPFVFYTNLILVLRGNAALYTWLLLAQILFYLLAAGGWILESRRARIRILFVPYYFCIMNYAVFAGFLRWLQGSQSSEWERAKRAL